jgi:hypothetical protein
VVLPVIQLVTPLANSPEMPLAKAQELSKLRATQLALE